MKIVEDDLDLDGEDDFTQDKIIGEEIDDYAEVEMTVAEPTKVTDIDGSVVIVSPGDIVTIKSESIKRVQLPIKEEEDKDSEEDDKEKDVEEK